MTQQLVNRIANEINDILLDAATSGPARWIKTKKKIHQVLLFLNDLFDDLKKKQPRVAKRLEKISNSNDEIAATLRVEFYTQPSLFISHFRNKVIDPLFGVFKSLGLSPENEIMVIEGLVKEPVKSYVEIFDSLVGSLRAIIKADWSDWNQQKNNARSKVLNFKRKVQKLTRLRFTEEDIFSVVDGCNLLIELIDNNKIKSGARFLASFNKHVKKRFSKLYLLFVGKKVPV